MAKNELLPFANGEDANVLSTAQWEALTDILENGFQSGIARSEQVNRVLAQGAVASYVLGQLIVDQLNKDATLDKNTLYQNLVSALQENAKDVCLPLSGGNVTGNLSVQSKNVVRSVNNTFADADGNVPVAVSDGTVSQKYYNAKIRAYASGKTITVSNLTANKPIYILVKALESTGGKCYEPRVTSGAILNSSTATVQLSTGSVYSYFTFTSGTSISLLFKSGSTSSELYADYEVYVFQ